MDYRKEIAKKDTMFKRMGYLSFILLGIMVFPIMITLLTGSKITDIITLILFIIIVSIQIFVRKTLKEEQDNGFFIIKDKAVSVQWTVDKEKEKYLLFAGKKGYEISEIQYNKLVRYKNKKQKPLLVINKFDVKNLKENSKTIEFLIYNS